MTVAHEDKKLTPERARNELIGIYKIYAVDHLIKKKLASLLYKTNVDPKYSYLNKSLEEFLKNKQYQEAYDLMTTFLFSIQNGERVENPKRIKEIALMKKDDESQNIQRFLEVIKMIDCLEAKLTPLQNLQKFSEKFFATTNLFLKDDKEAKHPSITKRGFFERGPQEKYHIYHKAHDILISTPEYQNNIDSFIAKLRGRLELFPFGKENLLILSMMQFLENVKTGLRGKEMDRQYADIQFIIYSFEIFTKEKYKESISFITNEVVLEIENYLSTHNILNAKNVANYLNELKYYDPRAPDDLQPETKLPPIPEDVEDMELYSFQIDLVTESLETILKDITRKNEDKDDKMIKQIAFYLEQLIHRLRLKPDGNFPPELQATVAYLVFKLSYLKHQYPDSTPFDRNFENLTHYLKKLQQIHDLEQVQNTQGHERRKNINAIFTCVFNLEFVIKFTFAYYEELKRQIALKTEKETTEDFKEEMSEIADLKNEIFTIRRAIDLFRQVKLKDLEKGSRILKELHDTLQNMTKQKITDNTKNVLLETCETLNQIQTLGKIPAEEKISSASSVPRRSR